MNIDTFDEMGFQDKRAAIARLADHREAAMTEYRVLVEHLRKKYHKKEENDVSLYEQAVPVLSIDELTHLDLVMIARHLRQPLTHADSYFRKIVERRRKKQLGAVPERFLGIGKEQDQLFADVLGVRMPEIHYVGPLDDIPHMLRTNTLLKPVSGSGSKGAYYLFGSDRIHGIQHSNALTSWDDMRAEIAGQFGHDRLADPIWQVQELIYEEGGRPARDMKFWSFYGRIGLIQEVSRHPIKEYQFFNLDGTLAVAGQDHYPRFKDPADTVTDKGGLSDEKLKHVCWLSQQIPAPFMRIDFLNAPDELIFLEFSAAPGMSNTVSAEYDELLGRCYEEAEMRLVSDLLDGKTFAGWREFSERATPTPTQEPDLESVPQKDAADGLSLIDRVRRVVRR